MSYHGMASSSSGPGVGYGLIVAISWNGITQSKQPTTGHVSPGGLRCLLGAMDAHVLELDDERRLKSRTQLVQEDAVRCREPKRECRATNLAWFFQEVSCMIYAILVCCI